MGNKQGGEPRVQQLHRLHHAGCMRQTEHGVWPPSLY